MNTAGHLLIAVMLGIALSTCGGSAGVGQVTGEIVEFGTFELGPGEPGTRETHFTSHGDVITAKLGSHFGFRFTLKNLPDAPSVELATVVTHPPIKSRTGETETQYKLITTVPVENRSSTSVTGYGFDRPEEMTPGVWTFEHSYQGRTLVKQSFTVRAPDGGG